MLVLSRKKDETVVIGDRLMSITVLEVRGDKVRLGLDVPRETSVHREEVLLDIEANGGRGNNGRLCQE